MPPKSTKKADAATSPDESKHASLSERVKEISTDILSSTALHVDAPEFRPKLRSDSKTSKSKSVPASERRSNRKSRESSSSNKSRLDKNIPRFFPAIVKDDLQNKVSRLNCESSIT